MRCNTLQLLQLLLLHCKDYLVFVVNFNNHDVTAHIQEKIPSSLGASTFNPLILHPFHIGILFSQVRGYSGRLRLVISCCGLTRIQMDKATHAMSFVPWVSGCLIPRTLAQFASITILTVRCLFFPCAQNALPPHSLQSYFRSVCEQSPLPPRSRTAITFMSNFVACVYKMFSC